jgi:hypothetical protein
MNAIGEEVAPANERDHFCWLAACEQKSVAQTIALPGAHRAVVKIEGEIADSVLLVITNLAKCPMIDLLADGHQRMRQPARAHSQSDCGRQLYSVPPAIIFLLEMAYPDRTIDGCDVNRRPIGTPDRHPIGTPSFYVSGD